MTRLALLLAALSLAACSSMTSAGGAPSRFDLGPVAATSAPAMKWPAIVLGDASGVAPLDSEQIQYRLNYADPLQAHAYANSQWSSPPLVLVSQRVRAALATQNVAVLGLADVRTGAPVLKLELLDFSHQFASPGASSGRISLRATLFQGTRLVAQHSFEQSRPAATQDAAGGVAALAHATDAVTAELLQWLASQN